MHIHRKNKQKNVLHFDFYPLCTVGWLVYGYPLSWLVGY